MPGNVWMIVPKNAEMVDPLTGDPLLDKRTMKPSAPVTWTDFVKTLCATPAFQKNYASKVHLFEVLSALRKVTGPGDVMMLAEDDWQPLNDATELLQFLPWNPLCYEALDEMFETIRKPLRKDPRVPVES